MTRRSHAERPTRAAGFSLPEVLVALALAGLLLVGLARLVATTSRTLALRDTDAEMRERARYALALLEPDVQMAGFYGLTARGGDFRWLQSGNAAAAPPATELRQTAAPLVGVPAAAQACGSNYAVDLAVPVQADDGGFVLGPHRGAGCNPSGGVRPGTDTVTLRRADTTLGAADPGRLQLLVDRSDERRRFLLSDGVLPAGLTVEPDRLEWHDLQLSIYYVSRDSVGAPGTPALRVKSLTRVSGRPALIDSEVMPGVEDLQVRLLTDSGIFDPGGLPLTARVRVVQVWLRVRAASTEPGYRDAQVYRYANVAAAPGVDEQAFRRIVVSRRIALRNAGP